MDTSPTCHKCNSVLTPFTPNAIISFSCNHQICSKCLVLYLLKHDISILTLESLNKNNITLKCKCDKGKVELSYEELIKKLTFNTNNKDGSSIPICSKHKMFCNNYCKECQNNLCSICLTTHNQNFINHSLAQVEKEEEIKEEKCREHGEERATAFCKECKLFICGKCVNEKNHSEHKVFNFEKIQNKISFLNKNLSCKKFEEFNSYINEKENYVTEKLNNEITFVKTKIEQTIEYLNNAKTKYISELYDNIYKVGLVFKIIKIIYNEYYKDLTLSINSKFNIQYKYLAHITQEISDFKINFDSSGKILVNIDEEVEALSKNGKFNFSIIKSDIDNLSKVKSAIKLKNNTHQLIECSYTLKGHSWSVLSLLLLHDGKLASASTDKTIKIWDISINSKQMNTPICTLKGHTESVYSIIQLSDKQLVSSSKDKTIKVWDISDIENPKELFTLKGHNNVITSLIELSSVEKIRNKLIASASFDTSIIIWDLNNKRECFTLKGHGKYIYALILLDKMKNTIASSSYKEIKIWDINTQKNIETLEGHSGWIYALSLLSDGRLVSGSYDKTIIIWDIEKKLQITTITGHLQAIQSLICIEGDRIVSGSWDKSIRIWDVGGGKGGYKEIATLSGHSNEVLCLCDIGNGMLASGSDDSLIKIWDISN